MHTFGRDLKWNPHIHCLLSEGGAGNFSVWRHVKHFNFTLLRNAFCTALLNELEKAIGPSFKPIKASIYAKHINGFYVRAKPNTGTGAHAIKYISRYLSRPVIASSRIDSYDGSFVTFHYNRHEDDKLIVETIPVLHFVSMLIRHIPEKHFKMIRYYGLYAKHHKQEKHLLLSTSKDKHPYYKSLNYWRLSLMASFNVDPLECPNRSETMEVLKFGTKKLRYLTSLEKGWTILPNFLF